MTTFDKNQLGFTYANALQDYADAKAKESENFYEFDDTMERVEANGFIDGYQTGAIAGFRHAIALLQAEQFTEHAQILLDQLKNLDAIFEVGE